MKKTTFWKSLFLLCALIVGSSSAWATDVTYTFTAKEWTSANGNWTNTTNGTGFDTSYGRGISIYQSEIKGTSPTELSNISSITVVASANKQGPTLKIYKVVNNTEAEIYSASMSNSNNKDYTVNLTGTNVFTGKVKVVLTSSSNYKSVWIKSVKVTYTPVTKTNTTLALDPTSLNLSYGGSTGTLTATVTPEGESALSNPTIMWESDDESVATVANGIVTPVGEGTTTITATYEGDNSYNGSSNTATVTVTDNRTAVVSAITSINPTKKLYIGGQIAFSPVVTLADGLTEDDVTYSYVSADPTTIQINEDGTYTALKTSSSDVNITVTVTPIAAKQANYKPVSATFPHTSGYRYSKPVFTATGLIGESTNFEGSMTLEMANDGTPVGPIYYTTNGDEPATDKSNCTLYENPLNLDATTTVKARVIADNGNYSTVQSATYTKVNLYTVTFDAGSGSCETASLKEADYNAGVVLPTATTTLTGWEFTGWGESKTSSTVTEAGQTYHPTEDCTLYAIYSKGNIVSNTKYTQETSLANVKAATKVVLVNSSQALTSDGSSIGKTSKSGTNDFEPAEGLIFTLDGDDTDGYTFTDLAGNTLGAETVAASGSGNTAKPVSLTTDNNKWEILNHGSNASGAFMIRNKVNAGSTNSAYLQYYSTNTRWQTYYTTNSNNNTKIFVYVPKKETIYNNDPHTSVAMTDATDVEDLIGSFAEEITYTRTMGKLSTIYLPFASEVPAGMTAYEFVDQESETKLNFTKVEGSTLKAYTPYVLEQSSSAEQTLSANNITIVADTEGKTTEGSWTFKGTAVGLTNAQVLEEAGSGTAYIINSGKWHPVGNNAAATIPAYRAYFICTTANSAKVMEMSLDGGTTAINGIEEVTPVVTKTRKVVKNGRLVIETANGEFTIDGARMK